MGVSVAINLNQGCQNNTHTPCSWQGCRWLLLPSFGCALLSVWFCFYPSTASWEAWTQVPLYLSQEGVVVIHTVYMHILGPTGFWKAMCVMHLNNLLFHSTWYTVLLRCRTSWLW